MINIADIRHIYFIGIGGIGMSALARYFHAHGARVSGYDRTPSPLTRELEMAGMHIHYTDDLLLAPRDVEAVVYTPAIPADHSALNYYRSHNYPVLKRSDVLGIISAGSFNICVAGTHGKTTISTMVAHLLRDTGYGCNAFLGGISSNYNTNFWSHERNVCVIEADEYDRSFLKLSPDMVIISAMDPDHLDIYGTARDMEEAYIAFAGKIRPRGVEDSGLRVEGGLLITHAGLSRASEMTAPAHCTYGLNSGNVHAVNLRVQNGSYHFDLADNRAEGSGLRIENLVLNVGGLHNVENMIAAITVALQLDISTDSIRQAVASYRGVKRRFEYGVRNEQYVYIDDYAHHPEELRALIQGVRSLYGNRELVMIFQPHLFSRTRDFADGFAEVLDTTDELLLLPIYPAREKPMEGVTSAMLAQRMKGRVVQIEKEAVTGWVEQHRDELKHKVLVTAGAGDIDRLVESIKNILNKGAQYAGRN